MQTVNLFFPENQDIARRCVELDDDIVNMQSTINGKFDDNAVVSNDLKTLVNDVMKAHNYKTYDELQAAVLASLTPEERKKIQATLDKFKELNEALDITFQVCMLITAVAGVVGLGLYASMHCTQQLTQFRNQSVHVHQERQFHECTVKARGNDHGRFQIGENNR